ncbi:FtsX-like permease family protein [Reyranella sp. CPCC 100927]|uniref:FtsX-like permease family protein n=1 Tax=Reyranella sp. CPCC 100927 TaxID=2599616 RepID=UPI0011B45D27|nr:FtsX-like permease family protein [Reyranella sp. CPCC 100927]TWT08802.1 FtsX-like permease family protein [Reyranella sp. CPCC 100927]
MSGKPTPRDLRRIVALAVADARHEWRATLCLVLALAAVLAPLLVLFGLRFGVVQTLTERLAGDPRNLEIVPIGAGRFDKAWFDTVKQWPEVAFVIPRTRAIAASMDLLKPGGPVVNVEMVPTAPGDPVLKDHLPYPSCTAAPDEDPRIVCAGEVHPRMQAGRIDPADPAPARGRDISVVLSASAARKAGSVVARDVIAGIVGRAVDGRQENVRITVRVIAVLPEAAWGRDAVFVPLDLLDATESFRDGFAEPALAAEGNPRPEGERLYAGFRLYGRTIYDIPRLRDRLLAEKTEVSTRAAEVEQLMSLDRNLGLLFWLIAGIGTAGFLLSLGVSLWGAVERKRRDLATLRLLGFRTRATVIFPVVQAAVVAMVGSALAMGVFAVVAGVINRHFAGSLDIGETACRLLPVHAAAAIGTTLICALAASALAGARVARIDPSEGLREV